MHSLFICSLMISRSSWRVSLDVSVLFTPAYSLILAANRSSTLENSSFFFWNQLLDSFLSSLGEFTSRSSLFLKHFNKFYARNFTFFRIHVLRNWSEGRGPHRRCCYLYCECCFQFLWDQIQPFNLIGLLHLQTAFIGVVVNIFIAIYLPRLPLLRNSFGRLLQLQVRNTVTLEKCRNFFVGLLFDWKRKIVRRTSRVTR